MRKKIKILLFLFIGLIILSCNYDDETNISYASSQTNDHFILKKVYLKEYSKNAKLFNQINKVKSKKLKLVDATGKIVNSSEGSFNINTDFATYIENNGKHSYTFKIDRENPQYLLENLVLNSNDSLGYDAYIVQYDINESEYNQLLRAENINLSNKVTLTNLVDENLISTIFNKEAVVDIQTLCLSTTVISGNSCPGEEHHTLADILAGQYCPYLANGSITLYASQTIYSWEECTVSIGIGGGGGTGGTSGGGSGSGNTTGNNYDGSDPNIHGNSSISTALTLEIDENNSYNNTDDINKLNLITQNSKIKNRITQMSSIVNISTTEQGSEFKVDSDDPNDYSEYIVPQNDLGFDFTKFPDVTLNSIIRLHLHHNTANAIGGKIQTIFSVEDIFGMAEFYNKKKNLEASDSEDITSIMVSRRGLYALRVKNPQKLQQFYNCLDESTTYKGKVMKKKEILILLYKILVIDKTNDNCNNCSDAQEEALFEFFFIKFFKNIDCGLNIYQAFPNQTGDYEWLPLN